MTNSITHYFNNKPIFITGHINPDGDALGAAFCLKILLDNMNITTLKKAVKLVTYLICLYRPHRFI